MTPQCLMCKKIKNDDCAICKFNIGVKVKFGWTIMGEKDLNSLGDTIVLVHCGQISRTPQLHEKCRRTLVSISI